ncbi:MAG: pilus assembly protein [Nocardioidaceae bacterium]|jgi:Flp pilus assembly protein TadG|nr:pilus assembly protein [Nocardioidaceae bacterium]
MMHPDGRRGRDERAGASLELVILAPLLIGFITLLYALGVYAHTEQLVDQAARDGVRVATQARSMQEAQTKAASAVDDVLGGTVTECGNDEAFAMSTSTGEFDVPPIISGEPLTMVTVTVTCAIDLGDVTFFPFPEIDPITSSFVSPLDSLRGYY